MNPADALRQLADTIATPGATVTARAPWDVSERLMLLATEISMSDRHHAPLIAYAADMASILEDFLTAVSADRSDAEYAPEGAYASARAAEAEELAAELNSYSFDAAAQEYDWDYTAA